MPKVTSVDPQLKNPHRFNIFLDGKFVFGADEDLVVEKRLVVGKEIPQEMVDKLIWEASVGKLMEKVMVLFDRRQRSEKEVRDYLRNLSFKKKIKDQDEISIEATEMVIEKLKQKGLLNDAEFASSWVESRKRNKKKGRIALKTELYSKGIDKDIISEVLNEHLSPDEEVKLAKEALYKRAKRWLDLPLKEQKQKSLEYLLRQGFSYEICKDVVDKMLGQEYNDL